MLYSIHIKFICIFLKTLIYFDILKSTSYFWEVLFFHIISIIERLSRTVRFWLCQKAHCLCCSVLFLSSVYSYSLFFLMWFLFSYCFFYLILHLSLLFD